MNELSVQIRPMSINDYDTVVELWQAAGLKVSLNGRDRREAVAAQLEHFPRTYLVGESDGRLVGVVLGTHDHRKGWINHLAVHPDYKRRGIALQLISACEAALRAEGIEIVSALVEEGNTPSMRTFHRSGYSTEIVTTYFRKRFQSDI